MAADKQLLRLSTDGCDRDARAIDIGRSPNRRITTHQITVEHHEQGRAVVDIARALDVVGEDADVGRAVVERRSDARGVRRGGEREGHAELLRQRLDDLWDWPDRLAGLRVE